MQCSKLDVCWDRLAGLRANFHRNNELGDYERGGCLRIPRLILAPVASRAGEAPSGLGARAEGPPFIHLRLGVTGCKTCQNASTRRSPCRRGASPVVREYTIALDRVDLAEDRRRSRPADKKAGFEIRTGLISRRIVFAAVLQ